MDTRIPLVPHITLLAATIGIASCSGSGGALTPAQPAHLPYLRNPSAVRIEQFAPLTKNSAYHPAGLAPGPADSLWVLDDVDSDFGVSEIFRVSDTGKSLRRFYPKKYYAVGYQDVAVAPDGTLWMTPGSTIAAVLTMTPGGRFEHYSIDDHGWVLTIARGSDGAYWFTERVGRGNHRWQRAVIGRITPTGHVSKYPAPADAWDITAGSDGALWFTVPKEDLICRITTGGKLTRFSKGISPGSHPNWIAAGPDGALWFTENAGRIGRITTGGRVREYSSGITPHEHPWRIAAGPDGAMWFTEFAGEVNYSTRAAKIGRITMSGTIGEYSQGLDPHSEPTAIAAGPDGNMWFVESSANRVGRVNLH